MCASCPQACITPTSCPSYVDRAVDLNGRSICSVTGNASMSARRATTRPGRPPFNTPTTPVLRDARLHLEPERLQMLGDDPAVRVSRLDSSGCWWISRRHAITLGMTA